MLADAARSPRFQERSVEKLEEELGIDSGDVSRMGARELPGEHGQCNERMAMPVVELRPRVVEYRAHAFVSTILDAPPPCQGMQVALDLVCNVRCAKDPHPLRRELDRQRHPARRAAYPGDSFKLGG